MKIYLLLITLTFILLGCAQHGARVNTMDNANITADKRHLSAKLHTELAAMYYTQSQLGVALGELDQALSADNRYAPAYGMRGLVYMLLRDDQAAERDFSYSLKLDNADSEVHNNYGWFLCERNRVAEAMPHFMTALSNPLYATPHRAYFNAGLCAHKAGNAKDAIDFLERALKIQSNNPEAQYVLSTLHYEKGRFDSANKYFQLFDAVHQDWTAEELWFGIRLMRKISDRGAESNYALRLAKLFPEAKETELLKREQYD